MLARLRPIFRRLRTIFRRDTLDRKMEAELRFHLEMQTRDNTETGVPVEEAAPLVRRQSDHVDSIKETVRVQRGVVWFGNLLCDFRLAARSLHKSPGFAGIVI